MHKREVSICTVELLIDLYLSTIKVQISTSNEQDGQIAPNICTQDTKVSPSCVEADAKLVIEFIAHSESAVSTV
jgi:hypothetical protein